MFNSSHNFAKSLKLSRYSKLILILTLIVILNLGGSWLAQQVNFQLFPRHDAILNTLVLGAALLYVVLMAVPFMPGIEIGLALMLLLGSKGALLVYICTLVALSTSFTVGKIIPPHKVCLFLNWLHLTKACALVRQLEDLNQQQRLDFLNRRIPPRIAPLVIKYRYLTLAALLNLPGNALIGGGGGISLVAGMSKIISVHSFMVLLAIATAPVPLWFFIYGG